MYNSISANYRLWRPDLSKWTFVTNHGAVLIMINQEDMITTRQIANRLSITERSVIRIINDLVFEGYVLKRRVGRTNQYKINKDNILRKELFREVAVGDLLRVLSNNYA